PAMRPTPQMNRAAGQTVHPFQPLRALQIGLCLVVVVEFRSVPVILQLEATLGKETPGHGSRIVPIHAELNRSFRKCTGEVLDADGERTSRNEDGDANGLA